MIWHLLASTALVHASLELGHFRWLRRFCARVPVLRDLVECHFCSGFWAGVVVALAAGAPVGDPQAILGIAVRGLASAFAAAVGVPVALLARQAMVERVAPHD